jgi:hypothetical protein
MHLELNGNRRGVKAIRSQAGIDKDLLAVDKFLCNHACPSKHGKASILEFLGLDLGERLGVVGLEAKWIEADLRKQ